MRISNKKGTSQNGVVMWASVLIAALITVNWTISEIEPYQVSVEKMNADAEALQGKIDAACNSFVYKARYNPVTEKGILMITDDAVCINNTFYICRMSLCSTGLNVSMDLEKLTYVVIEKNDSSSYNIFKE